MTDNNDVQFDTDQYISDIQYPATKHSLTDKLVSWGIAKDTKQAIIILVAFSSIFVLITFWIIFSPNHQSGADIPNSPDVIHEPNSPPRLQQPQF